MTCEGLYFNNNSDNRFATLPRSFRSQISSQGEIFVIEPIRVSNNCPAIFFESVFHSFVNYVFCHVQIVRNMNYFVNPDYWRVLYTLATTASVGPGAAPVTVRACLIIQALARQTNNHRIHRTHGKFPFVFPSVYFVSSVVSQEPV